MNKATLSRSKSTPRSERFTVSIPAYLFELGEQERSLRHLNRSEFVAYLYETFLEEVELERRRERYKVAYSRVPETSGERALVEMSLETVPDGAD